MKFKKYLIQWIGENSVDRKALFLGYIGVITIGLISLYFNWIPINLNGLFGSQEEIIIRSCINGGLLC